MPPTPTTGLAFDSLPEIANAPAELGEPKMAINEIEAMFAGILSNDAMFERAAGEIIGLHFHENEGTLATVWATAVVLHRERRVLPLLDQIAREISSQNGQATLPNAYNAEHPLDLVQRLGDLIQASVSSDNVASLVARFLQEREVTEPVVRIMQRAIATEGWGGDRRPADFPNILCRAAERLAEIGADWGNTEPWGPLEPLTGPELPVFPLETLPAALQNWVAAEAESTQTPPDLAAMLCLAVCAAAAARRIEVQVRNGWREPVNIFVACLLESANRKSAVFRDATEPLRRIEREAVEQTASQVRQFQMQERILKNLVKRLEDTAGRETDAAARQRKSQEAEAAVAELDRLLRVHEPQIIIDDCTPEMVEIILAQQGGRIACMSPEGGVFGMMKGRYTKSSNFSVYLKGHAGDEIRTGRVGRESVFVDHPAITMALAVQPNVISGLADTPELRGQGLLARFLYCIPASRLGARDPDPLPLAPELSEVYSTIVTRIGSMVETGRPSSLSQPDFLRPSVEATAALHDFIRQLEPRLGQLGDLAPINDWAGKLAGGVVRLAGILHLVKQATQPEEPQQLARFERAARSVFTPWDTQITAETMRAAVQIGEYLIPHAAATFNLMGLAANAAGPVVGNACRVADWIQRQGKRFFTRRDAQQGNRSRFPRAADVDPVLALLVTKNVIRHVPNHSSRPGGRPSEHYQVNPEFFNVDYFRGRQPQQED